jgi:DHA1 family multidrug resistance protein-like MFS transporter
MEGNLMRLTESASIYQFSTYMYENLGHQWASTLVAFLSLVCVPMPFAFYYYGAKIRERSRFAPTLPPNPVTAAAGATISKTTSAQTEQNGGLDRIVTSTSHRSLWSHRSQHRPVVKVRQPSIDSALEPEYALDAGVEETDAAPKEMQGLETRPPTGHQAV